MLMDKIDAVLGMIESKDRELYEHLERTAMYAFALAKKLEMSPKDMETAYFAGLLHDVGKLSMKENKLDEAAFEVFRDKHYLISYLMLQFTPELKDAAFIIFNHHEYFNGTGRPNKLAGIDIPLLARILKVADAYDKIRFKGATFEEAADELRKNSGTQFDPALIEPFIQIMQEEDLI